MEAALFIGILGAGYLLNKDKDKNPIVNNVTNGPSMPSMNNTYDSTYVYDTQKEIAQKVSENFNASNLPGNIVNFQKTKVNHGLEIPNKSLNDLTNEGMSNYAKYTFSSSAGGFISNEDFLTNDQGIKASPFFKSQPPNVNFDDSRQLDRTQGKIEGFKSKREVSGNAFSDITRDGGNVFGNTFKPDTSRYDNGSLRNNELPFVQEMVSPIDPKSNFNREIAQTIADRSNIDNLRTLSDQKTTYEGRILSGQGIGHRGKQGDVFKYNPDKYYKNNPNKWLVTNGAFLAKSTRPEQILPDTNRKHFNKGEFGPAAPTVQENSALRGNYKKTLRQQLGSDTLRNAGTSVPLLNNNMVQKGYRALPNERQITELRTYDSNIRTEVGSHTVGIQDGVKNTIKQTTINSANNGYLGNNVGALTNKPFDKQKVTKKDAITFDYTGNAGAYVLGDTNKFNYMNAETNPTKEIIAQGRAPTLNNTKIANGMDTINMDIKKIEDDYMNHRLNGVDKVYGVIPQDNTCQITTTKDRLNDNSIANRIEPGILDPFKQNPYSQSLSSFAY